MSDEREYYHPGGVRPYNCHCPECFTQEDSDALDRDFAEDREEWAKAVADGREDPNGQAHNPETCRDPACDCMPF